MNEDIRRAIERATQRARALLEDDFTAQLDGTFDIRGEVATTGGVHLSPRQHTQRGRIVAAIEHKRAAGMTQAEAVGDYIRDAAFTTLNRFAALKMLEARDLVQECVSRGEESSGYREFYGLAPALLLLPNSAGYRLYIESLFDELSTEIKVLFDRRDPASVLWPGRATFEALLEVLNRPELTDVWGEDETIGWVYQYFNSQDERRAMRDASQAPRNGRELAIRNQFFTPRYVVQFLVENTLARMWLEMMGDETRLPERCEYLVREGTELRPRSKKDPRDFKLLDPACGSGHFLLYAFDLLLAIYEEAWHDTDAPQAAGGATLRADFPDLDSLRRAIPALIVERNLHGVDIDARPTQIAALALWMRAQRAWRDFGISRSERPRLKRTNVVVAEPMPGNAEMVEEFAARLDPPLLGDLFRKMVTEMRLAGELGTLLRVEVAIAGEVHRAREVFVARRKTQESLPGFEPTLTQGEFDLSGIDDDRFFHEAEERIIEALNEFSESAGSVANARRALFAGDAAQGIALIDLLRAHFDVVLMNPPFGDATKAMIKPLNALGADWANNLLCAFIARARELLVAGGYIGVIYDRTANIKSTYETFRLHYLLSPESCIVTSLDLGWGVLDANVEVTAAAIGNAKSDVIIVDVRDSAPDDKASLVLDAVAATNAHRECDRAYVRQIQGFSRLPNAVVSGDFPEYLVTALATHGTLQDAGFRAYSGYTLKADQHYRLWWEVPHKSSTSYHSPMFNGSGFEPYTTSFAESAVSHVAPEEIPLSTTTQIRNRRVMGLPGACFGKRGDYLAVELVPSGMLFTQEGRPLPVARLDDALKLIGYLNTPLLRYALNLYSGQHKTSGYVNKLPAAFPPTTDELVALVESAVRQRLEVQSTVETDRRFVRPVVLESFREGWEVAAERHQAAVNRTREAEEAWEEALERHLRVPEHQRRTLRTFADSQPIATLACPWNTHSAAAYAESLISYAVGVAFGRFDVRTLLTGLPTAPSGIVPSFEPLPRWPPAVLCGADGSPVEAPPTGYAVDFPPDGILVDDSGHGRDIVVRIENVFRVLFPTSSDVRLQDVFDSLAGGTDSLRMWIRGALFNEHLKRYSRSRRKAPIYWELGTRSREYALWLYAHRLTSDTLFQIHHELLRPKLNLEERKLLLMVQGLGSNPTTGQRKRLAEQEAFLGELRTMSDEVERVAPLWNPDLADGVVITMAPLWRLVPQNAVWQRELKATWEALAAGESDWTHLAMHLWPERVVWKCAEDRSLAMAHGLDDVFWEEGLRGKWNRRRLPTHAVEDLIHARTSAAVKSALKSLTDAPTTTMAMDRPARNGRGGR